jgi:hypothetical protein
LASKLSPFEPITRGVRVYFLICLMLGGPQTSPLNFGLLLIFNYSFRFLEAQHRESGPIFSDTMAFFIFKA